MMSARWFRFGLSVVPSEMQTLECHGLASHETTDLTRISTIIPGEIADKSVTSVAELSQGDVQFEEWESRLQAAFTDVFQLTWNA